VQDLVESRKKRRTGVERARTNPIYALIRSLFKVIILWIRTFMVNPTAPLTDPLNWSYTVLAYGAIYTGLILYALLQSIGTYLHPHLEILLNSVISGNAIGVPELLKHIGKKYGKGQCVVTWSNIGFYLEKASVVHAALPVLCGLPSKRPEIVLPTAPHQRDGYVREQRLEFNVDLAKALVLMAAAVYERDNNYVKLAAEHPEKGTTYLLRSEELMVGLPMAHHRRSIETYSNPVVHLR
jgi:hypothetical protein